ncbi:MAG: dihydroneopterin aldolase [Verrucomicrobiota bacterium]
MSHSDVIRVRDLVLPTVVGVPDEERELPQSVSVDLTIRPLRSFCGIDDDISATINYYDVTQRLREVAADGERILIETLVEDLAGAVLDFDGVASVTIELKKYILAGCGPVSVEVTRQKR